MPALRSSTDRSSEAGFVFRSQLPAASRRAMIPFFRHAIKIKRSLDTLVDGDTPNLLHYELVADLGARRFTISSAWRDEAAFRTEVAQNMERELKNAVEARVKEQVMDKLSTSGGSK